MRLFRLALTATVATAAFALPGGAHAEECPGRSGPTVGLHPLCVGTETEGWGGSLYAYAGVCETRTDCTVVKVPVEDTIIAVATIVNDTWDKITP